MFQKTIHKTCINQECKFHDQPQDAGLYICECGHELQPVQVTERRMLAAAGLIAALMLSLGGLIAYELLVNRLNPAEAVRVLLRIHTLDKLQAQGRVGSNGQTIYVRGWVFNEAPDEKFRDPFIKREENGAPIFRYRHVAASNENFRMKVESNVSNLYLVYKDKTGAVKLGSNDGRLPAGFSVPTESDKWMQMDETPGTETFVLIAAEKPVAQLDAVATDQTLPKGSFEQIVGGLQKAGTALICQVEMPHS